MNNTIKFNAIAQLCETPETQPDMLARLWDAILTNLSLDERAMVQASLNKLTNSI